MYFDRVKILEILKKEVGKILKLNRRGLEISKLSTIGALRDPKLSRREEF